MSLHYLVMYDEGEEELSWWIEHPDDCPTVDGGDWVRHDCPYDWEVSHAGADAFDRLPEKEGRYSLEFWVTEHRVPWVGTEVSSGIAVVERIGEGAE